MVTAPVCDPSCEHSEEEPDEGWVGEQYFTSLRINFTMLRHIPHFQAGSSEGSASVANDSQGPK